MTSDSQAAPWTTSDLEGFADNSNRYEIIDGELFVTRAPHWHPQLPVCPTVANPRLRMFLAATVHLQSKPFLAPLQ